MMTLKAKAMRTMGHPMEMRVRLGDMIVQSSRAICEEMRK